MKFTPDTSAKFYEMTKLNMESTLLSTEAFPTFEVLNDENYINPLDAP